MPTSIKPMHNGPHPPQLHLPNLLHPPKTITLHLDPNNKIHFAKLTQAPKIIHILLIKSNILKIHILSAKEYKLYTIT